MPATSELTGEHRGPYGGYYTVGECCSASQGEGVGYTYDANKHLCTIFSTVTGSTGTKPAAGITSGIV